MGNPSVFAGANKKFYQKWTTIFKRKILQKKDIESSDDDARLFKIHNAWERFRGKDLPAILEEIKSVEWPEVSEPQG